MDSDRKPPQPKSCPICRLAMVAGKTDDDLAEFNTYECLRCDLVITFGHVHGDDTP